MVDLRRAKRRSTGGSICESPSRALSPRGIFSRMPTIQSTGSAVRNVRVVYTAMVTGIVLFALVAHFILLPGNTESSQFDPTVARGALAAALALCGLSLLLLRGVPRRSADDSAETFWRTAAPRV